MSQAWLARQKLPQKLKATKKSQRNNADQLKNNLLTSKAK
jgi:hypothetical protein